MSFNLIITYEPGPQHLDHVFKQLNSCIGTSYVVLRARPSLLLLRVDDPYRVWYELKKTLYRTETPIQRIIPVDEVVDPLVDRVAKKAREYALKRIPENSTYRVTLHGKLYKVDQSGRLVKESSIEAIKAIANGIDRKVDLKNPQWVVYVRTVPVGKWFVVAALSVAKAIVFKNVRVGEPESPL